MSCFASRRTSDAAPLEQHPCRLSGPGPPSLRQSPVGLAAPHDGGRLGATVWRPPEELPCLPEARSAITLLSAGSRRQGVRSPRPTLEWLGPCAPDGQAEGRRDLAPA